MTHKQHDDEYVDNEVVGLRVKGKKGGAVAVLLLLFGSGLR